MRRLFTEHPHEVGETYWQHLATASSFGLGLIGAGLACMVHAIFPFMFVKTGSREVTRLHGRMVSQRDRRCAAQLWPQI
jgi:hypothetical protein